MIRRLAAALAASSALLVLVLGLARPAPASAAGEAPAAAPTLFSMDLNPPELIGGGTVTAEPDLTEAAPSGGVTVQLTSSDPALAAVPSTVTIPAGSFLANATITTGTVTTVTDVTITATLPSGSLSSQLQIDPPETVSALSLNPATTSGTNGSSGEVTLGAPSPPGFSVDLSSSDPSVASVPAAVSIGDGATGIGFDITTSDVTTATTVTITASTGSSSVSATLTVDPPAPPVAALQSVSFSPGSVPGGSAATGTATLTVPAPAGGAVVSLVSSDTRTAKVPASVTIPAGATSATFPVTTRTVKSATTVGIGGVYGGAEWAGLLGVTGGKGGSVLPSPPSGVFIEPSFFDPTPVNSQRIISVHPLEFTLEGTLKSFTISLASGALPKGLSLTTLANGVPAVEGVPTATGLYAFVLKFTLSDGTAFAWPYVWQIFQPPPLVVTQVSLPAGTVGQAYSGSLTASGGVPPYNWFIPISSGSLPPGLTIDATTGQITGTPTTAGSYSFTVQLFDANETTVDTPATITISG